MLYKDKTGVRYIEQRNEVNVGLEHFSFIRCQIQDIFESGIIVCVRKVFKAICCILLLPFIIIVRIIRPLILVRFGTLESSRLGHFTANTELYLCERDDILKSRRAFDIFYNNQETTCNQQLQKMWDRSGYFYKWSIARFLAVSNILIPGYKKHIAVPSCHDRDVHGLYERMNVHISFTEEEEKKGYNELVKMGIPYGAKFVIFHSRDSSYLDNLYSGRVDMRYHNYRDSNIENFKLATEELVQGGLFAIRVGAIVKNRLKNFDPCIIDYATKFRTDFLDVFLGAKCLFYLGDSCGVNGIPSIFRRPIATTNMVPIEYVFTWGAQNITIPKKHWLVSEKRFMSFREIFSSGAGRFLRASEFQKEGIELIENTPDEIRGLAIEMDERINGTWLTNEEDEELQRRFWSIFPHSELHGVIKARIGAHFLRQNQELLE